LWCQNKENPVMNENFLYYLWQYYFPGRTVAGTKGETIDIFHPGQRNTDSGPDFFNGKVKIDNTLWAGNVEIHVHSSDWYRHGHQNDEHYDSIILHVVYKDDKPVFRQNGQPVTTLEIKGKFDEQLLDTYHGFLLSKQWVPCQEIITRAGHFQILQWLQRLAIERLERKAKEIQELLRQNKNDFREVFYQKLLQNYGFQTNAEAFARLARSLPYSVLAKHKDNLKQLESLLFGQAGLLNKVFRDEYPLQLQDEYHFLSQKYNLVPIPSKAWRFMRMHPPNFPTIRIAQFAGLFYRSSSLLQKMLEAERLGDVTSLLQTEASPYWKTHYHFDKNSRAGITGIKRMGKASIHLLFINTIIPFLFVYGRQTNRQMLCDKALEWLTLLPPEKNTFSRHFSNIGIKPDNALQSQALIRLKLVYCNNKQCLHCGIGHQLLKSV